MQKVDWLKLTNIFDLSSRTRNISALLINCIDRQVRSSARPPATTGSACIGDAGAAGSWRRRRRKPPSQPPTTSAHSRLTPAICPSRSSNKLIIHMHQLKGTNKDKTCEFFSQTGHLCQQPRIKLTTKPRKLKKMTFTFSLDQIYTLDYL
jgi:hypothetical protein